jgi:hypothetical protein
MLYYLGGIKVGKEFTAQRCVVSFIVQKIKKKNNYFFVGYVEFGVSFLWLASE